MVSGIGTALPAPVNPVTQNRGGGASEPALKDAQQAPLEEIQESVESQTQQAVQAAEETSAANPASNSLLDNELTPEEKKVVEELKRTDAEVRAHEQAHKSVGGSVTGPISYETVTGPDGKQYAVSGEVPIDASPVPDNPAATIRKMDIVIRAALAPADPSPQDFAVARQAQQTRQQAQKELRDLQEEEKRETQEKSRESPLDPEDQDPGTIRIEGVLAAENLKAAGALQDSERAQIFSENA